MGCLRDDKGGWGMEDEVKGKEKMSLVEMN
jgi:hypothetical protein